MQIVPYLNFNGQCAEAFELYAEAFGGRITFTQTFGESPMKDQVPADWQDKVMHMTLVAGDQTLYGADAPPPHYATPQGMTVSLDVKSAEEGERIFAVLAERGQVRMPFSKTFWSPGFGMVVDRYGIPWMVNCETASA